MEDTAQQFAEIFEKHSDELFRHAVMRLSDRERAVELTQETFLKAWNYMSKGGEEVRQYRSFLYRILNNLIIDEYRKHKTQSLDAMLEHETTEQAVEGTLLRDETDNMEEAMIRFESAAAVKALTQLTEQHRTVLVMRYIDGLSPKEIAETMQESENTISVRIHRGIKKLRELLEENPI
ncbi:MAG: RNA polymerase sigma factor [Candidatus Adlerbacteria bacterium]|nr:RNA polymerase sigma factor [Candidatus Adlerbacteria bacterium]